MVSLQKYCWRIFSLMLIALTGISVAAWGQKDAEKSHNAPGFYQNPVLWEDLADIDVIRVGDAFYYSASNMHYSPGAPLLRSYDLTHWEYVGHSIPVLDFSPAYDLKDGRAYVKGSWASFLGYRQSNKTFYWGGCIEFSKTHLYTAEKPEGPWKKHAVLDQCYYDAGLLIDDDDTMYVAYGNTTINVAQLSPDGVRQVRSEKVFTPPDSMSSPDGKRFYIEGSRFYKVHGNYYILTTHPASSEYVLRSTTGPFGPYTMHPLVVDAKSPVQGSGAPHQGGIVQTQKGDWYYMAFIDAFPGGRIPVLAPLHWSADGWPEVQLTNNAWNAAYPDPLPPHPFSAASNIDRFSGSTLGAAWEWNHNPDNTKWSIHDGLELQTATVTDDLYQARNTLTHRIPGPASSATIELDPAEMRDGDRAGLAMFRNESAWIGVKRENGKFFVAMNDHLSMDESWKTKNKGVEAASRPVSSGKIWLRAAVDVRPGAERSAQFSYSTDGSTFTPLGVPFVLNMDWRYFMGYRYAIFNYATQASGGKVHVRSFEVQPIAPSDRSPERK
jgi:beta-xylosidase